jgi:DNA repair protein RecN (Recombination protein N)
VLEELRIQGLGVIEDAVLELAPGLTVVTGETGAGKTMVVQGLTLLFGGRADAGRVRPDAGRADLDDGALLVSRSVGSDGRSRAHLGGRGVPMAVLAEIGESVLAIHGQSDQQRLLVGARQRDALDRYAGEAVLALRERFRSSWAQWRDVRETLAQLTAEAAERVREAELLRLGLAEVEAVAPSPGESQALAEEIERLANADDLRTAAAQAQQALTGDDAGDGGDALQQLTFARRLLEAAGQHDPQLAALAARAQEAAVLAAELAQDMASYAAGVDADPVRLTAAQERLSQLTALMRRHGTDDVGGVLAWADQAGRRLLDLDSTGDNVAALTAQDAALAQELGALAGQLSEARSVAAGRFGTAVTSELVELAMPHAVVSAQVSQRESGTGLQVGDRRLVAGPEGVDDVELLLVPHPGAPARPLQKGASGGELSRVMLAVEVVFAGSDPLPLMVFDEVDAGVGGKAAVEVGRRLARLARDHQVVVVTHLPQVAAFADRHLLVHKDTSDGAVTSSGVVALNDEGRVQELARMLGGLESDLGRGHAQELLDAAASDKRAFA